MADMKQALIQRLQQMLESATDPETHNAISNKLRELAGDSGLLNSGVNMASDAMAGARGLMGDGGGAGLQLPAAGGGNAAPQQPMGGDPMMAQPPQPLPAPPQAPPIPQRQMGIPGAQGTPQTGGQMTDPGAPAEPFMNPARMAAMGKVGANAAIGGAVGGMLGGPMGAAGGAVAGGGLPLAIGAMGAKQMDPDESQKNSALLQLIRQKLMQGGM